MTLDEIKTAVDAGRTVHWANAGYVVIHDRSNGCDQWLIIWDHGGCSEHCIGLTWRDGVTMNGREDQFYIAGGTGDEYVI